MMNGVAVPLKHLVGDKGFQNVVDVMKRFGRRRSMSASGCPWASWRCSVPSRR